MNYLLRLWQRAASQRNWICHLVYKVYTLFRLTDELINPFMRLLIFADSKEQVLANLANFAYDPGNVDFLKELQVTDLFLDMLTEENENFVEFGMGE